MTITELVRKLQDVRAEHGDVTVVRTNHDVDYGETDEDIERVEIAEMNKQGFTYDYPRPGEVAEMKVVVLS